MSAEKIAILEGEEAKGELNTRTLEKLIQAYLAEDSDSPEKTRTKIHELIEQALNKLPAKLESAILDVRDRISKHFTNTPKFEEKVKLKKELQGAIEDNEILIAQKNKKTIGMVKIEEVGKKEPIYEIRRLTVMPEERNQGIAKKLVTRAVRHIQETHGKASILMATKKDAVKKICKEMQFEEIGFKEYLKIWGIEIDDENEILKKNLSEGWTAYLYKPQNLTSSPLEIQPSTQ